MKKKIIIVLIVLVIASIVLIVKNRKSDTYVYADKRIVAISDGNGGRLTSIPSKGLYKVTVYCNNATGKWDYINWDIVLENISGDVSCSLVFESIEMKRLSDYIKGNYTEKPNPGSGNAIVHEIDQLDGSNYTTVTSFNNVAYYLNNNSSSLEQTTLGNYWTLDETTGVFTSNPSLMSTSYRYYHVNFNISDTAYYRICYSINQSTNSSNKMYIKRNSTSINDVSSSTSSQINDKCVDLGKLTNNDIINVSEYAYSGASAPQMTFRIEKSGPLENIDTGYRYEGKNPDNYVWFNNELWRIIGVFSTEYDSTGNGVVDSTHDLVKMIRVYSEFFQWDKANSNRWENASLYNLLNKSYYDWNTYKSVVSNYCTSGRPRNCNYSIRGIQDGYRDMIVNAKWYLGYYHSSGNYSSSYPINIYSYERNADTVSSNQQASILGHVGLMYVSDYGYSVLASVCPRGQYIMHIYSDGPRYYSCAGNSWLNSDFIEWSIMPYSSYAYFISSGFDYNFSSHTHLVRPVIYLNQNVYLISGDGTPSNPYIIGM